MQNKRTGWYLLGLKVFSRCTHAAQVPTADLYIVITVFFIYRVLATPSRHDHQVLRLRHRDYYAGTEQRGSWLCQSRVLRVPGLIVRLLRGGQVCFWLQLTKFTNSPRPSGNVAADKGLLTFFYFSPSPYFSSFLMLFLSLFAIGASQNAIR